MFLYHLSSNSDTNNTCESNNDHGDSNSSIDHVSSDSQFLKYDQITDNLIENALLIDLDSLDISLGDFPDNIINSDIMAEDLFEDQTEPSEIKLGISHEISSVETSTVTENNSETLLTHTQPSTCPIVEQPHANTGNIKTFEQNRDAEKYCKSGNRAKHITPENLNSVTKKYGYEDICSNKLTTSIYERAIKKIHIDEKKLFMYAILEEFSNKIESNYFDQSCINISSTYSNIRKYIMEKLSLYINNAICTKDIAITPGMSISNIKDKCISNEFFFDNLSLNCKEITEKIRKTQHEEFLPLIQSYINFVSLKSLKNFVYRINKDKKNKISVSLKRLVIDTINDLPLKIKSAIEKFEPIDILRGTFVKIHGAYISKSFVRNLANSYSFDELMIETKFTEMDKSLTKSKIEKELLTSVIYLEGNTISLDEPTASLMVNHLLLDIDNIYTRYTITENEIKITNSSLEAKQLRHDSKKNSNQSSFDKEYLKTTSAKINAAPTNPNTKKKLNHPAIRNKGDFQRCKKYTVPEKLKLVTGFYGRSNMFDTKSLSSIYENALKKINVDEKKLIRKAILIRFSNEINCYSSSFINISRTYLNIRRYIANKICPNINKILCTADISLIPGMTLSDVYKKCISNKIFFEKLRKKCKEIAKKTDKVHHRFFLTLIQKCVHLHPDKYLYTDIEQADDYTKNKISLLIKYSIIKTICSLPKNIKSVIEKFNLNDIYKSMFVQLHGAYVTKSFIRDVANIYVSEILIPEIKYLEIDNSFIKIKLKELLRRSTVILNGNLFSPNRSMVSLMSGHLLLDMIDVPLHIKWKLLTESKNENQIKFINPKIMLTEDKKYIEQISTLVTKQSHLTSKFDISSNEQQINSKDCVEQHVIPEQLAVVSDLYNYANIFNTKLVTSIYEIAIEKIDVDEENMLKNTILKEFNNEIKTSGLTKSRINISKTYSNIRKYIIDKISPYINEIIRTADICITPGMSILGIYVKCISNKTFFDKLRECCKKTSRKIRATQQEEFLHIIQNHINFSAGQNLDANIEEIDTGRKNKLSSIIKSMIVDNIINLPQKIKCVIENFSTIDVLKGLFTQLHGAYVTKSFMRTVVEIYNNDKSPMKNKSINIEDPYIKEKLEKSLQNSVILVNNKMVLSPNKSTVSLIINNLLLDIYSNSNTFTTKSNSLAENVVNPKTVKQHNSTPQNCTRYILPEELKIMPITYKCSNICYAELRTSIYEYAIEKIDVDEKKLFEQAMLEELGDKFKRKGLNKSHIDITRTCSNIRKYISNKISPCINCIIRTENINLTPGMSISDIHRECISNHAFFDKLFKCCKEIEKDLEVVPHKDFLCIAQRKVDIDQHNSLFIDMTRLAISKKERLTKLLKILIIDTIRNLPNSIKSVIEKLGQGDISKYMFVNIHGILVTKSFIRNVIDIRTADKLMVENKSLKISKSDIITKLEELVDKSFILYEEKLFLPNKYTAIMMANYLLLDITKDIYSSYYKSFTENGPLKLNNESTIDNSKPRNCLEHLAPGENIYELAIRKINIDEKKVFMDEILRKFNIDQSSINISVTYSNVRNYILDKIHPYLDNIIRDADILISPGMSISYIKHTCMSNFIFFDKLYQQCNNIVKDINDMPNEHFFHIFDSSDITMIGKTIDYDGKNKISQLLKYLIVDTILCLPQKIILAIDRSDITDISDGLFKPFHNVRITKSFLRNIMDIYNAIDKEKMENESIKFVDYLIEKGRLKEIVKKSTVLIGEIALLPNKYTARLVFDNLLSDMSNIYKSNSKIPKNFDD
ncbi:MULTISPECIES: hypothetical protein [Candidatus Ichthyocystis]|nr:MULTISPECIES: hypothetical protein [Ichthyocystis]